MKTIYTAICLLLIVQIYADMPGNKARPSFDIRVKGITENSDYLFYASMEYDDSARLLNDSSSIYVPGGYGAPAMVFIWAVNKQTRKPTDSLFFSGGEYTYNPTFKLSVLDNHLQKEQLDTEDKEHTGTTEILSEEEIREDNWKWRNITSTLVILASVAFTIFVYLFYKRKKNQES